MEIKIGDLFFTRSHSILSKGIRFFTHGHFSHVQVVVHTDPLAVVSADAEGVICRSIREDEWDHHAILTCPILTEDQRRDICHFCFSKINSPYDYTGLTDFLLDSDLQSETAFFCSELAFLAYKEAGVNLQERIDHAFVSPEVLYISPLLKEVKENE